MVVIVFMVFIMLCGCCVGVLMCVSEGFFWLRFFSMIVLLMGWVFSIGFFGLYFGLWVKGVGGVVVLVGVGWFVYFCYECIWVILLLLL